MSKLGSHHGLVVAAIAGCGSAEWTPTSAVGSEAEVIAEPADEPITLDGDMLTGAPTGMGVLPEDTLAADDAAPRVFYLFYADGTSPQPGTGRKICSGTPPAYTCSFGGAEGVEGCKKKNQVYLDRWYKDFNLIFTLEKPTSGKFYTEIITKDGAWCGMGGGIGGVAPFSGGDMNGGICYAFLCGGGAKTCAVIVAQEHAHLVGLQHTNSTKDLLYPSVCSACDGFEDKVNTLSGGGGTQNSYQMMKTRLGPWDPAAGEKPSPFGAACTDMAPPTLTITEPADGAAVGKDFNVKGTAMDDCTLKNVHIKVTPLGAEADATASPFSWPLTMITGRQTIELTATDVSGKTSTKTITVTAPGGGGGSGGGGGGSGGGGGGNGGSGGSGGKPSGQVGGSGCSFGGSSPGAAALLLAGLATLCARQRRRHRQRHRALRRGERPRSRRAVPPRW